MDKKKTYLNTLRLSVYLITYSLVIYNSDWRTNRQKETTL